MTKELEVEYSPQLTPFEREFVYEYVWTNNITQAMLNAAKILLTDNRNSYKPELVSKATFQDLLKNYVLQVLLLTEDRLVRALDLQSIVYAKPGTKLPLPGEEDEKNDKILYIKKIIYKSYTDKGIRRDNEWLKGQLERDFTECGSARLRERRIQEEIIFLKSKMEKRREEVIATGSEVLQFYTSVMRGQILDQFGIEASLDTRIKAANELAKHQIEMPLRLAQKREESLGNITLNFLPRPK